MIFDYTLRTVALGVGIFGFVAGALGAFAVLRKQSLLGDAISHACLPGIALAFLLTFSKHPLVLLLGAAIAGWVGTILIMTITKNTIIKKDSAMGIILSVFFGIGIVLLTLIQRMPLASQAGLETFLFGSASTLLRRDVFTMIVLSIFVLIFMLLFWKEFKLLTFDTNFMHTLGFSTRRMDILLTTLIVLAIVIGLQTVGVVLMSAMLIAPGSAARQWTDKLQIMVLLAACFGAVAGVLGAIASSLLSGLPTGPAIVVVLSIFVFISLFFSPHRGIVWDIARAKKNRKQINLIQALVHLLRLAENHKNPYYSHPVQSLQAITPFDVERTLHTLKRKEWVTEVKTGHWALTKQGVREARRAA